MTRPRASQAEQPSLYLYLSIYLSREGQREERSRPLPGRADGWATLTGESHIEDVGDEYLPE